MNTMMQMALWCTICLLSGCAVQARTLDSFRSQESMEYDSSEGFDPPSSDGLILDPNRVQELRQDLGRFTGHQRNGLLPIRGLQRLGTAYRNKGVKYSKHQLARDGPRLYNQPKFNKDAVKTYPGEGRYDVRKYKQVNPFEFDKSVSNNLVIEVSDEADRVPYVIGDENNLDYPSLTDSIQYLGNGLTDVPKMGAQWDGESQNTVLYEDGKNSLKSSRDQRDCQHIFSWLRRIISKKGASKKLGQLHEVARSMQHIDDCLQRFGWQTLADMLGVSATHENRLNSANDNPIQNSRAHSYDHETACETKMEPQLLNVTHDRNGREVLIIHGEAFNGDPDSKQEVFVHSCASACSKCRGVSGHSRCELQMTLSYLLHSERRPDSSYGPPQWGLVYVPSHCACVLLPAGSDDC